jgi:hypothetical protein
LSVIVATVGVSDEGELMHIERRRTIAILAVTCLLAACGPLHRGGQPEAVIVFHNQSVDQADVFALGSGGDPVRIGTVFSGRTETLRVPASVTGAAFRVNVVARIFPGGRVVVTGPFSLGAGESMDVTLTGDEKILSVVPSRTQ